MRTRRNFGRENTHASHAACRAPASARVSIWTIFLAGAFALHRACNAPPNKRLKRGVSDTFIIIHYQNSTCKVICKRRGGYILHAPPLRPRSTGSLPRHAPVLHRLFVASPRPADCLPRARGFVKVVLLDRQVAVRTLKECTI